MADPTRVAVVDDHRLFREGLRALVGTVPDLDLVADGADGDDAVRIARELRPAVLLLDLRMPGPSGLESLRRIREEAPEVSVVMLTMVDDSELVSDALREGASGYVLKGADPQELLRVIRAAAQGEMLLTGVAADQAKEMFGGRPRRYEPPLPQLSDRERAILDLLAAGHDAGQIAAMLYLSPKTVRNYLTAIPRRLGVADRAAAVTLARQQGLGRA